MFQLEKSNSSANDSGTNQNFYKNLNRQIDVIKKYRLSSELKIQEKVTQIKATTLILVEIYLN